MDETQELELWRLRSVEIDLIEAQNILIAYRKEMDELRSSNTEYQSKDQMRQDQLKEYSNRIDNLLANLKHSEEKYEKTEAIAKKLAARVNALDGELISARMQANYNFEVVTSKPSELKPKKIKDLRYTR